MAKLGDSWGGVVMGDDQFDIVLDFGPEVASRVSETNWHRSQSLTPLPNGGVRFELRLPSLMEFVPWVRSWGPAVKVVVPEELRSQIADSLRQAAAMYGEEWRTSEVLRTHRQAALSGGLSVGWLTGWTTGP